LLWKFLFFWSRFCRSEVWVIIQDTTSTKTAEIRFLRALNYNVWTEKCIQNLCRKTLRGERPLGRPKCRLEDNIKMCHDTGVWTGLNCLWTGFSGGLLWKR